MADGLERRPTVVLADDHPRTLPGIYGFETARRIREPAVPRRIAILTIAEDWEYTVAASSLRSSYVLKRRIYSDLIPAACKTLAVRLFLSPIKPKAHGLDSGRPI